MTDLDKIKACARAMKLDVFWQIGAWRVPNVPFEQSEYNPLENSAQADALEGWLLERGTIQSNAGWFWFYLTLDSEAFFTLDADMTVAENRRRARVECVAKMMEGV